MEKLSLYLLYWIYIKCKLGVDRKPRCARLVKTGSTRLMEAEKSPCCHSWG